MTDWFPLMYGRYHSMACCGVRLGHITRPASVSEQDDNTGDCTGSDHKTYKDKEKQNSWWAEP